MDDSRFPAFIRHAATAVSRRRSLGLLGVASLAGVAQAATIAGAGVTRKKAAKRQKRCRPLGEQCRQGVAEICQTQTDPAACQELHAPCCQDFARCRVSSGVECVIAND